MRVCLTQCWCACACVHLLHTCIGIDISTCFSCFVQPSLDTVMLPQACKHTKTLTCEDYMYCRTLWAAAPQACGPWIMMPQLAALCQSNLQLWRAMAASAGMTLGLHRSVPAEHQFRTFLELEAFCLRYSEKLKSTQFTCIFRHSSLPDVCK